MKLLFEVEYTAVGTPPHPVLKHKMQKNQIKLYYINI